MDSQTATRWAQKRLRETGRPIAVAILSEVSPMKGDGGAANSWRAVVTDGREQVEFTLVGRRSFTDAEDKILRESPRGGWLERLRERPVVSIPVVSSRGSAA